MSTEVPFNALPVDFVVAEWRIEQVLGAGDIGIAYRAVNAERAETVAIIEYLPDGMVARGGDGNLSVQPRSPDDARHFAQGREQFLAEGRMLARVSHPNVARVHRTIEANNTAYLVLAHEAGDSLETFLARSEKRLKEDDVKRFARGLLEAVAAVHAAGFHHGALTPDTIKLRADFSPVLFEATTMLQARDQVPGYSPIEQYAHDSPQGPATDIYSIAAVLYRMIGGRAPLDAASRLLDERHVSAGDLGAARYERVFLRAVDAGLAVRPEERPQTIAVWRKQFDPPAKSQRKVATIRIPEGWRQPKDEPKLFEEPRFFEATRPQPPEEQAPAADRPEREEWPERQEPTFGAAPIFGDRPIYEPPNHEPPERTAEAEEVEEPPVADGGPPEEAMPLPPASRPQKRPWLVGGSVLAVCVVVGAVTAVAWRVSQDQPPTARQQFDQLLAQHPSAGVPAGGASDSSAADAQAKAEEAARQREAQRQQAIVEAQARTKAADEARAREVTAQREREAAEAQARAKAAEETRAREAVAQRERETAAVQARAKAAEEAKVREAAEAQARAKAAEEARAREVAQAQARAKAAEEARARETAQAQARAAEQARAREAAAQREREIIAARVAREAEQSHAREAAQQRQQEQVREAEASRVAAAEQERQRQQAERQQAERQQAEQQAAATRQAALPSSTPIEESSAEPRYVLVPGLPKLPNGSTSQRQIVSNAAQVGHIESVNNSWGFVVVQMDRRQGVEVGDRVYARDGNEKLWMRVTRVRGSQISAAPEALLWRYVLNLSVFKD